MKYARGQNPNSYGNRAYIGEQKLIRLPNDHWSRCLLLGTDRYAVGARRLVALGLKLAERNQRKLADMLGCSNDYDEIKNKLIVEFPKIKEKDIDETLNKLITGESKLITDKYGLFQIEDNKNM